MNDNLDDLVYGVIQVVAAVLYLAAYLLALRGRAGAAGIEIRGRAGAEAVNARPALRAQSGESAVISEGMRAG